MAGYLQAGFKFGTDQFRHSDISQYLSIGITMNSSHDVQLWVNFQSIFGGQFHGNKIGKGADKNTCLFQLSMSQYPGIAGIPIDAGNPLGM